MIEKGSFDTLNLLTMRHLSFLGGVLAITSLSLLFSSCEKTIDSEYANRQETGMLADKPCKDCIGEYIGFHTDDITPDYPIPTLEKSPFYFWRAPELIYNHKAPLLCRQHFLGTDFSDNKFFNISAEGGQVLVVSRMGALGVNDEFINVGEALVIELSECMNGNLIDGFYLVFHGNNDLGVIELYKSNKLIGTVPYSKAACHPYPELCEDRAQAYPVTYKAEKNSDRFDKMIIRQIKGRNYFVGKHGPELTLPTPENPYPKFYGQNWWHLSKDQ